MAGELHISASSSIKNNGVYKNGELVFEQPGLAIDEFLPGAYKHLSLNYPKFYKMDSLSKLGLLASEILLQDFDKNRYPPEKVGVILSNTNSSLDADIKYWHSAQDIASPALFVYTLPNIVIGEICIRHGFKGEHAFYITPEFDARFIQQQVQYLFDNNIIDAAICGWVDVLGEEYSARLFLVEKVREGKVFEVENLKFSFFNIVILNVSNPKSYRDSLARNDKPGLFFSRFKHKRGHSLII